MPVRKIERTKEGIMVDGQSIDYSLLPGRNNAEKAAALQIGLQAIIDYKIDISQIKEGDPRKTSDPKKLKEFYEGDKIVFRSDTVTVTWNTERNDFDIDINPIKD